MNFIGCRSRNASGSKSLSVRHCIVGAAPEYLTELCRPVSSSSGRQSLRSASRGDLIVPRFWLPASGFRDLATGLLLSLGHIPGMLTRPQPHEAEAEATTHEAEAEATTHEAEATTHEAEAEAEAKTHLEIPIIIILYI